MQPQPPRFMEDVNSVRKGLESRSEQKLNTVRGTINSRSAETDVINYIYATILFKVARYVSNISL